MANDSKDGKQSGGHAWKGTWDRPVKIDEASYDPVTVARMTDHNVRGRDSESKTSSRKVADCRDFPSEKGCTLTLAGEENEVLEAAVQHAVSSHGHLDTPELRGEIRKTLKDEPASWSADRPVLKSA